MSTPPKRAASLGRVILVLPMVALQAPASDPPANYSIKGNFRYQLLSPTGKATETLLRHFDVEVDGRTWSVKVLLDGTSDRTEFIQRFDGENLLSYGLEPGQTSGIGGTLEPSPVPPSLLSSANEYPWLAFASASYFSQGPKEHALWFEPARSVSGHSLRVSVPIDLQLSERFPHLPSRIAYYQTETVHLDEAGRAMTNPLPQLAAGTRFKRAEYEASAFTNVGGLEFPTRFEFREHRIRSTPPGSYTTFCAMLITGVATNISVGHSSVIGVPGRTLFLQDQRIPEPTALLSVTNGLIPATNTVEYAQFRQRAARAFELEKLARPTGSPARPKHRVTLLCGLMLLVVAPVIYSLFSRAVNKKQTKH
jgi:hypothetical protein